jgi:hypothetical protein
VLQEVDDRLDPNAWTEFAVAAAGASAVLAGLVFVAVSINLEKVLEVLERRSPPFWAL